MLTAIFYSIFMTRAVLKPELAIAQNGYYTPVDFSAWINVVNSVKEKLPPGVVDWSGTLPSAAEIIGICTFDAYLSPSFCVEHQIWLDILTGLVSGASIEMPLDDRFAVCSIKLSRFELLRASFHILNEILVKSCSYTGYRPVFIMMFRLIIANHFETLLSNHEDHPSTFQKATFPNGIPHELGEFNTLLTPRSRPPTINNHNSKKVLQRLSEILIELGIY